MKKQDFYFLNYQNGLVEFLNLKKIDYRLHRDDYYIGYILENITEKYFNQLILEFKKYINK